MLNGHLKKRQARRYFKGCGDLPLTYFNSIKRGANGGKGRSPIEFNVTIEYLWDLYQAQNKYCFLSLLPIDFKSGTASLDRIDSSMGYIEGNLQWLHKDVNMMKRHYSTKYFLDLCERIADARI